MIHCLQAALFLDQRQAVHHVPRKSDGGIAPAERIGRIAVHHLRVGADPVIFRPRRLELIVISAEHQRGQQFAVSLRADTEAGEGAERLSCRQNRRGLPAGAAENRAGQGRFRMKRKQGPREERAHAVPEQKVRKLRKFGMGCG